MRLTWICLWLSTAIWLSGCGGSDEPRTPPEPASGPHAQPAPNIDDELPANVVRTAQRCDWLDASHCMLPFPNDHFTVADGSTPTGRRLNLQQASMPVSALANQHPIETAEWNRNDGFSPGAMIVTRIPDVDLERSGAPLIGDISVSLRSDTAVMVIDADTLEKQLIWAELDRNNVSSEARRTVNIRMAKNLQWRRRYIVALRNLKDAQGNLLQASPAFRIYRDNHESALEVVNARRPHMEALFATLEKAGVARDSLYLAWDFTVASQQNLTGRLLSIRDQAFSALNGAAPAFTVTKVVDAPDPGDARIARRVEGVLTVPKFTRESEGADKTPVVLALLPYVTRQVPQPDIAGIQAAFQQMGDQPVALEQFDYGSATPGVRDVPRANGTLSVPFTCNIPASASAANPARIALYGHGLFGKQTEVNASNVKDMASEHNMVFCAANWYGFSESELGSALFAFMDLSYSRALFDTTQQGMLNMLMLGRAFKHADGFAKDAAFQDAGASLLDTRALFYDGNSQGGILGGALVAVSPDIERAVLGVPGMNYSLLLERSADFPQFAALLYAAYPDSLEQQLVFSLWQTLWDRAETNGYAAALTDQPLPNTPAHKVLLHVAYGDRKVTMWAADIMARSSGLALYCPALEKGRHPDANPYFQLSCMPMGADGFDGSGMVVWDSGPGKTFVPSQDNVPPDGSSATDPHEDPRATPAARQQKSDFLRIDGRIRDVCQGIPCRSAAFAAL